MPLLPVVDVNLFVFNGEATVDAAIESVRSQTWPAIRLTLIDDGSTDATFEILREHANRDPTIRIKRNRSNTGAIPGFQRAFWFGDADFVMPKSGDDLIAPDFVERVMEVLLAHPACMMCHAAGLVFTGEAEVRGTYPAEHALLATSTDPLARARQVMARYTSSPSFWGIYRRDGVDRLAPIRYRAGWDHALLAELALYGEIRHVPEVLYWRRDGGKPVGRLARAATELGGRGLGLEGALAEQRWRTPLITTAYAHIETFALARLPEAARRALIAEVPGIFRARWLAHLRHEAAVLRAELPGLLARMAREDALTAGWMARGLSDALRAVEAILPEEDFSLVHLEITTLAGETFRRAAA